MVLRAAVGMCPSMPGTESGISVQNTALEEAISGSDVENLADGGPADLGRLDVDFYGNEVEISAQ